MSKSSQIFDIAARPFGVTLFYILCQLIIGAFMLSPLVAIKSKPNVINNVLCISLWIAQVITIAFVWRSLKMFSWKSIFSTLRISLYHVILLLCTAIIGFFGIDILCEFITLPDWNHDTFNQLSNSTLGMLTACVVAPISEELIFRGAILIWMKGQNIQPIVSIVVSALVFGLMHMNPAQFIPATLMGLILASLYLLTGNLIAPIILHISNNTLVFSLISKCPELELIPLIGDKVMSAVIAFCCIIICVLAYYLIYKRNQ